MISDARGGHVSPGVYTEEKDVLYSAKSLGITSLGLAGETLKGPAFQNIPVTDWADFVDYFGGTSTEKYKGTGLPKYELPYVAKEYLKESKNLNVVRVLGLSGYETSPAYGVKVTVDGKSMALVILRSKADYDGTTEPGGECVKEKQEKFRPWVTSFEVKGYTGSSYDAICAIVPSEYTVPLKGKTVKGSDGTIKAYDNDKKVEIGKFSLEIKYKDTLDGEEKTSNYNVSLNQFDVDYIYKVFSTNPLEGSAPVYIESVYDYAYNDLLQKAGEGKDVEFETLVNSENNNFKEIYRCAQTPWVVSEVKTASSASMNLKKLFKFYTISDGNAANYQVKISIQRIRPDEGLFDVWVRDFYDTDDSPIVLEKFSNLTMAEGNSNYIGLKIGTFDGGYAAKSKYITVEISDEDGVNKCIPCGFLGYPIPKYGTDGLKLAYNKIYDDSIKPKRQYFGLNHKILDEDILNYKGVAAYNNAKGDADPSILTNGFHLDSILSMAKDGENVGNISGETNPLSNSVIYVDSESGYTFTTVEPVQDAAQSVKMPRMISEEYCEDTIYEDINLRKFTLYPYGGFDGWDIYRDSRTNIDKYKATKYAIVEGCPFERISATELVLDPTLNLGLKANSINSDYYAYLAGYNQFANPNDVYINLFVTPGIDYQNNRLLVEEALDLIEDQEDGRGGDALYVVNSPMDVNEDKTAEVIVEALEESEINSSYACTYWPWIKYYDSTDKRYITLPVTKDVVRNMAQTDNNSFPWFAPAGTQRGDVECIAADVKTTLSDEDTLYEGLVNPIKTFGQDGVKVWGNKTMYRRDTPLNRINVRRLMLRVKKLIVDASKHLIFEQNDATVEKQFRSLVEPILADVKSNRGIVDYRVETESTPETHDQHILPAKIAVKPVNSLEYVSISFVVYPESVDFIED